MRTFCIALIVLMAGVAEPLLAADYRFQALIDLDGDTTHGCAVEVGETRLAGGEFRAFARTDRARVLEVVLQSCVDAAWRDEFRSSQIVPIAHGQGENGSDRIRWSLPLNRFGELPPLSLRLLSERLDVAAYDSVDDGAAPRALDLDLGSIGRPIPTLDVFGRLIAVLVLLLLGWRHMRRVGRHVPLMIALPVILGMVQLVQPVSRADADVASSIVASDVSGDSTDAGSDILRAQIAVVGQTLEFQFDVSNIEDPESTGTTRVLFIGNSLTYTNDLPLMVEAIAAQAGKVLVADAITAPGAALEDHFNRGLAQAAIASGGYQWVIMQQGPSSLPASQVHLSYWAGRFDPLIRASGARPALFMVWPEAARRSYFSEVRNSYSNAAYAINGMFIPAGEAWRESWHADPELLLYGSDQFHPSELGSYVAALSIFSELYRQSPEGLPPQLSLSNGQTYRFSPEKASTVQAAAWRTHLALGRSGG